jgi:hypothetical protein
MTRRTEILDLAKVKTAQAEKYERLARQIRSKTWRKRLLLKAKTYRQQVADLAEMLERLTTGH